MPTLSIKNVPEAVVERLRQRATRNHRSMQGELMALVCDAVAAEAPPVRTHNARTPGTVGIEELAREHRARRPEPVEQSPRAVDLIRQDRDRGQFPGDAGDR